MSKINNTTAYVPTAPTATTILIGSEIADGATRNYLVSALATYMSTNLTDLTLSGFLTVGGATTLNGTLGVTGATTIGGALDVTGGTEIGGNTSITGTLSVIGNTTIGAGTANSLLVLGGLTSFSSTALADTTVSGLPKLTGLSTFADNATALGGGLVANDVYKTATGELRIVV